MKKTIYYQDEINDDFFSGKKYNRIKIDGNYKYLPQNFFKKLYSFVLYYFFAWPFLSFYMFVVQRVKINDRQNLKELKKRGYMIVGNHTHYTDAYVSQIGITRPRRTYIIANENTVQIPLIGGLVKALGALPTPRNLSGLKNFESVLKKIFKKNQIVCVFPEAHIWPYYTGLRPFPLTCFKIASKNKVPVVPIATTYKKRRGFLKPKAIIFVGKPIFYNKNLTILQNAEYYRNMSQEFIKNILSSKDNYEYIKYVRNQKDQTNENNICNTQQTQITTS